MFHLICMYDSCKLISINALSAATCPLSSHRCQICKFYKKCSHLNYHLEWTVFMATLQEYLHVFLHAS
jgi:hypothetical protein